MRWKIEIMYAPYSGKLNLSACLRSVCHEIANQSYSVSVSVVSRHLLSALARPRSQVCLSCWLPRAWHVSSYEKSDHKCKHTSVCGCLSLCAPCLCGSTVTGCLGFWVASYSNSRVSSSSPLSKMSAKIKGKANEGVPAQRASHIEKLSGDTEGKREKCQRKRGPHLKVVLQSPNDWSSTHDFWSPLLHASFAALNCISQTIIQNGGPRSVLHTSTSRSGWASLTIRVARSGNIPQLASLLVSLLCSRWQVRFFSIL